MQRTLPRHMQMLLKETYPKLDLIIRVLLLPIFIAVILAACAASQTPSPTHTATIQPSATPLPTYTPTPIPKDLIILLADNSFPSLSSIIFTTLQELSVEKGWEVQNIEHTEFDSIPPNLRLLVSLPPDPDIQDLALHNPGIQFLAIGIPGLDPQNNLSILSPDGFPIDKQAFISGYASAVITKDWRVGMIVEADTDSLKVVNQAFTNGFIFYCGLCLSAYPPFQNYPIIYSLSADPSEEEWMNASDFLLSYSVETILIYSYHPSLSALQYLINKGIILFGIQEPPQELDSGWASAIRFVPEALIQEHWGDLSDGTGGWMDEIPIQFDNINAELFSTGRQRWVNDTLTELLGGFIEAGDPSN